MLTKGPNSAASANADAKTKHARKSEVGDHAKYAATPAAIIDEPKAEWVPLASAPFRYNSCGYIRFAEKWDENLGKKVKHFATSISSRADFFAPEYSFQFKKNWEVLIKAGEFTTVFNARGGVLLISQVDKFDMFGSDPDELLNNKLWKEFPPEHKPHASWHRSLLTAVLTSLRRDFGEALNRGSAHVVARKNTVLAPFERVAWDQWQYFKLDEPEPTAPAGESQHYEWVEPASPAVRWCDPRNCGWGTQGYRPSTATGPNGEKLYAIHVAPGVERTESGAPRPEEKCIRWLMELMTVFPKRPPKPRAALIQEAMAMFPRLSERGFARALFEAQRETGNFNWSSPGAPRKTLR